jgi:hypothetical protein
MIKTGTVRSHFIFKFPQAHPTLRAKTGQKKIMFVVDGHIHVDDNLSVPRWIGNQQSLFLLREK